MNENVDALPPLSEESIARIERAVFDEIEDAQHPAAAASAPSSARRRRGWVSVLGIAAAFAVGTVITPPLLSALSGPASVSGDASGGSSIHESAVMPASGVPEMADSARGTADGVTMLGTDASATSRDIITSADLTLRVTDVEKASRTLAAVAGEHGGYVESAQLGEHQGDGGDGAVKPVRGPSTGWITLRVPASDLDAVIAAAGVQGDVLSSAVSREDVTAAAVDLRARVEAARASVQRLTELMAKSGSVADLIAAETALNERQAELESYEQQLKSLDEQVSMSALRVQLTERASTTTADPAGFGDGLLTGWNGLVVALNALVVAAGFLLPWAGIAAVVFLIIWLIRRRRQ